MRLDLHNYLVCAAMAALLATPVYGQSLGLAGAKFESTGTVDYLNFDNGTVVFGDVTFFASPNTPVVLPSGEMTTASALKRGTMVGYTTVSRAKGRQTITRIWVLPKDYVPPAND